MTNKALLIIAAALALTACQADNPGFTTKPKIEEAIVRTSVEQSGDRVIAEFDSRIDILFVIDNSRSMINHQKNLSANITKFVDEFAKIKSIDFHIGVTTVWDSSRYGSVVPAKCPDGTVNWEPAGTLVPLIGPSDILPKDGRRFVTREDNFSAILKKSLSPIENPRLFKDFVQPDPTKPGVCASGPEKEEVFTPMISAITDPTLLPNKGFRREGAFLVVIIVSDAKSEDVPNIWTPETVQERLSSITDEMKLNKKRFRVFSVVYKSGTQISNECPPDPAFDRRGEDRPDGTFSTFRRVGEVIQPEENPLETLALLTQDDGAKGQVLSICNKNYGEALGTYGAQVKQDALADLSLRLPSDPQIFDSENDPRRLQVFLGKTPLIYGDQWTYKGGSKNTVTVYGQKVNWDAQPDDKVRVTYVPVDLGAKTTKVYDPTKPPAN